MSYPFCITLPRHKDHIRHRDPRADWLESAAEGYWTAEFALTEVWYTSTYRIYQFDNEKDFLMFTLKWGNEI